MTTYAERRERLFWSQSKHRKSKIRKKQSVNKLKRYGSNIDQRLWSNDCDDRRRAILEKLTYIDTGLMSQALATCFTGSTSGSNGEGGNQEYMKKIKDLENEILKLSQIIKFLEENCGADKSVLEAVSSLKLGIQNLEKDSSKSLASKDIPSLILTKPSKEIIGSTKSLSTHIVTSSEAPGSAKSLGSQGVPGSAKSLGSQEVPGSAKSLVSQEVPGSAKSLGSQGVPGSAKSLGSQEVPGSAKSLDSQGVPGSAKSLGSQGVPGSAKSLHEQDGRQIGASPTAKEEITPITKSHTDDELAVTGEDPCGSETHIVCDEDFYPYNGFGGFLCGEPQLSGIPTVPVKPTDFQPFLPVDCSCYDATERICSETQDTSSPPYLLRGGLQEEINTCDECWRDHYSSRTNFVVYRNKNDNNIRTEKESIADNIRQQIQRMCCLISGRDLLSCESAIDSEVICVLKAAVDILEENWLREDRETNKYTKLLQMYQAQCCSMKALKCQLSNVTQEKENLKRKMCHNVSDGILTDINAVKTTQSFLSDELRKLQSMSVNLNNIALERDALMCKLQELESVARSKEFQLVDYKAQIEKQQGIIDSLMRTLKSSKIEDSCFGNKQHNSEIMPSQSYKIPSRQYSFSDTQMNINENEQINTKILQEKLIQHQKLIEVQKECMLQQKMYICEQEEVKNCLVKKVEDLLKLKIKSLKDQNENKKIKRGSFTKTC